MIRCSRSSGNRSERLTIMGAVLSRSSTSGFGRPLTTHGTSTTGSVSLHPFRLRLRARTIWWCRSAPTLSRLLPASPPTRGSACLQLQPVTAMTGGGHLLPRDPSAQTPERSSSAGSAARSGRSDPGLTPGRATAQPTASGPPRLPWARVFPTSMNPPRQAHRSACQIKTRSTEFLTVPSGSAKWDAPNLL